VTTYTVCPECGVSNADHKKSCSRGRRKFRAARPSQPLKPVPVDPRVEASRKQIRQAEEDFMKDKG